MYDLGILGKCIYSTCYSVVKSTSDGEKYIALHDSLVGCHVTMHTDVTDIEWMVSRNSTLTHNCSNYRYTGLLCKLLHFFSRMCDIDSAAAEEHRLLCILKLRKGSLDLSNMYTL